ncbi:MAG TPA: hypothetical protein VHE59_02375 [Mucilaginibacter sp.]|nr:hypothetical protein [Mucilaginibacter sp.]
MEERFIVEKKSRRILIVSMTLILVPLGALVYWKIFHNGLSRAGLVLKEASDMSFHGRVDSIYFDRQNHNAKTLILSDGYEYELYPDWSWLVTTGDSLAKDTGSLKVIVYKKGKKANTLDYKQLVKGFK